MQATGYCDMNSFVINYVNHVSACSGPLSAYVGTPYTARFVIPYQRSAHALLKSEEVSRIKFLQGLQN